jgi:hypothetical protein
MSFRIFAAGTPNFNYSRENCADGDLFQAAEAMDTLMSVGPMGNTEEGFTVLQTHALGAGVGLAESALPSAEGNIQTALRASTRAHLGDGVTLLASCNGVRQEAWISVNANRSQLLGAWPDATGFAQYNFFPNYNPGAEFMRVAIPVLERTSMNNWGVLLQMDIALRNYYLFIHGRGTPRIQIQLFK